MAMASTFSFCLSNMARFTYHIYFVYFGGFFSYNSPRPDNLTSLSNPVFVFYLCPWNSARRDASESQRLELFPLLWYNEQWATTGIMKRKGRKESPKTWHLLRQQHNVIRFIFDSLSLTSQQSAVNSGSICMNSAFL